MAIVAKKLSHLDPYVGLQIQNTDYIPIIYKVPGAVTYLTLRASSDQVANYFKSTLTNQALSTTNDVIFNSLTCTTAISSASISAASVKITSITATNITIDGRGAVSKFSADINHTGSTTASIYNITHPIPSEDVTVQLFEKTVVGSTVSHKLVITEITNTFNPLIGGVATVSINSLVSADFRLILTG